MMQTTRIIPKLSNYTKNRLMQPKMFVEKKLKINKVAILDLKAIYIFQFNKIKKLSCLF